MNRLTFLRSMLMMAIVIGLSACSSTNINKLEGQWQLFWINDLSDENIYIWNFEGGEITIVIYSPPTPVNPNPQPVIGGRAQYKTSAEFLDAVVEISGFVQSTSSSKVIPQISNGKWTIDKIDNESMRLATADQEGANGSYVIREFVRP
jgi:hypothetical protein